MQHLVQSHYFIFHHGMNEAAYIQPAALWSVNKYDDADYTMILHEALVEICIVSCKYIKYNSLYYQVEQKNLRLQKVKTKSKLELGFR